MGSEFDNDVPPPAERRPARRKRVLLTGIVAYSDGARSFDCTIRNVSQTGARIVMGKNQQFPTDFYLINIRDRVAYDAKVIWNDGSEVGVTFKKTYPLSELTEPKLSFLKRLWLSKAAR
ncbi:MAG TPA: PilZ domain-containing protein [Rhizomicrobium sp.]|nr:PilZ domain-containing protein [Rhizomicrobium sp.]